MFPYSGTNNQTGTHVIGYLFITGLLFAAVGLYCLIDPVAAMGLPLDIHVGGVNGFNQERGTHGGVTLAIGLLLIASARWQKRLVLPSLWTVVTLLGGLEIGRFYSMAVDGVPGGLVWFYIGFEMFGLLQGIFWLRRELGLES